MTKTGMLQIGVGSMRTKIEFPSQGQNLAGLLETPDQTIRAYVLFAHCFTCGKDIAADMP